MFLAAKVGGVAAVESRCGGWWTWTKGVVLICSVLQRSERRCSVLAGIMEELRAKVLLDRRSVPIMAASFPSLEALSWSFSPFLMVVDSLGEISSFGLQKWATVPTTSLPSRGRHLGESAYSCLRDPLSS